MAAVLCLVFLPLVFAVVGFTTGAFGSLSVGGALAGLTFLALAGGMVVGALRLAHGWDGDGEH